MLTQPFMGTQVFLPPKTNSKTTFLAYKIDTPLEKKLLILDLDETLIHSETMRKGKSTTGNYDFVFTIKADESYNYDEVSSIFPKFYLTSLELRSLRQTLLLGIPRSNEQNIRNCNFHSINSTIL